jgi:hypothetical protein
LFACVRQGGTLISSVSVPDEQLAQQGGIAAKFILVDVNTEDLKAVADGTDVCSWPNSAVAVIRLERQLLKDKLPSPPMEHHGQIGPYVSRPTPMRWPNSFAKVCRSASGSGGANSAAMFSRRCCGSPVPNSTTSTPGSCRTKR